MESIDRWVEFFGWFTLVNLGIYTVTLTLFALLRRFAAGLSGALFGLSIEEVSLASFQYFGHYKLAITVLCIAPYIALKIMS
tara:strand:- start:17082 stop:17327 length:246 start_codon:yes stop_codon:yes gene_type:complete